MSAYLEPNRIPAEPIVAAILEFLDKEGTRLGDEMTTPAPMIVLAERADLREATLYSMIRGRTKTVDFDVADRLLCAMNMHDLWLTDLHEVYVAAGLHEGERSRKVERASGLKVCARKGCSNTFTQPVKTPPKKYCSETCCAASYWHKKHGAKTTLRGPGRKLEKLVCRNGHERTPENTGFNGVANFCRICKNASDRRSRARARERNAA